MLYLVVLLEDLNTIINKHVYMSIFSWKKQENGITFVYIGMLFAVYHAVSGSSTTSTKINLKKES